MVPARMLLPAATLVLALSLAACGGSTSKGLSRAQLGTKVNAACRTYNSAESAVAQPPDFATNAVAAAAYLDKIKVLVHTEVDTIAKLAPAASVKSDFDAYRAAAEHQAGFVDSADAKAHARDRGGLAVVQQAANYQTTTLAPLARRLGFTDCVT